jgi:hypothetical protein
VKRELGGDFVRHLVDGDRHADAAQESNHPMMELGHRLRLERERLFLAPAGAGQEAVAYEIELELKDLVADRDRRRAEPPCSHVEGDLPTVIQPGCQGQTDLAHDLRRCKVAAVSRQAG